MKNIVFSFLFLSSFAQASCPNLFNGDYRVKVIHTENVNEMAFPASEREQIRSSAEEPGPNGYEANSLSLGEGMELRFEQKGCGSVQISAIEGYIKDFILEHLKVSTIKIHLTPEVATGDEYELYKKDELVQWSENTLTFSRRTGVWPFYRKYKTVITKHADGSIEVKDVVVGCALLPAPIPAKWVEHYKLIPIK